MQRGRRMTKKQKEFMVNYLEQNTDLLYYNGGTQLRVEKEIKWKNLARGLNSTNLGPSKTTVQWKDTFKDFRTSTRRKYKQIRSKSNDNIKFSDTEKKFMKLLTVYAPKQDIDELKRDSVNESTEALNHLKDEYINSHDQSDASQSQLNNILAQDDPLQNSDLSKNSQDLRDTAKNTSFLQDGINIRRMRLQERLQSCFQSSLPAQQENNLLQLEKLTTTCDNIAESIKLLATANNNIAAAINNAVDRLINHFQG